MDDSGVADSCHSDSCAIWVRPSLKLPCRELGRSSLRPLTTSDREPILCSPLLQRKLITLREIVCDCFCHHYDLKRSLLWGPGKGLPYDLVRFLRESIICPPLLQTGSPLLCMASYHDDLRPSLSVGPFGDLFTTSYDL